MSLTGCETFKSRPTGRAVDLSGANYRYASGLGAADSISAATSGPWFALWIASLMPMSKDKWVHYRRQARIGCGKDFHK